MAKKIAKKHFYLQKNNQLVSFYLLQFQFGFSGELQVKCDVIAVFDTNKRLNQADLTAFLLTTPLTEEAAESI